MKNVILMYTVRSSVLTLAVLVKICVFSELYLQFQKLTPKNYCSLNLNSRCIFINIPQQKYFENVSGNISLKIPCTLY